MSELRQELLQHFAQVVLKTATKLQSWNDTSLTSSKISTLPTCDDYGMQLYHIIEGLTLEVVGCAV